MFELIKKQERKRKETTKACLTLKGDASSKCWHFLLCWRFFHSFAVYNVISFSEDAEIWPDKQNTTFTEAVSGHDTVSLRPLKLWKTILNYSSSRFLALKWQQTLINCLPLCGRTEYQVLLWFLKNKQKKTNRSEMRSTFSVNRWNFQILGT